MPQREILLRPDLGVVQRIPVELGMVMVLHDLDVHVPLRVLAAVDGLVEVLGGGTQFQALHLGGFIGGQAGQTTARVEVVLDEDGLTFRVHHLVGVDAEALHVPIVGRDPTRAEQVCQHVHGFGRLAHEVEDAVRLLPEGDRVRLQGVDHIRELDRVSDEEDR
jgi:hypothetical protein